MDRLNKSNYSSNDSVKFHNSLNSFNLNTNHPLIQNSQEYIFYKKYISIHSEDRDTIKYPNAAEFEIELPEDLLNVASLSLVNWSFPSNYDVFSGYNGNVGFVFKITNPYNPAEFGVVDDYNYRIYEALVSTNEIPYQFVIEEGFYNPEQMVNELTNKFNFVVTKRIIEYFTKKNELYPADGWNITLQTFKLNLGYKRFTIVYNNVSARIWFGNTTDPFILINEVGVLENLVTQLSCNQKAHAPNTTAWGLPNNLGLPRCNTSSISSTEFPDQGSFETYNGITVPRFFYGNVLPGDDGFWLLPNLDLSGSVVHWVECPYKINLMGEAYMYMEIAGQNCIDETQPFNLSPFTITTNQTNGIVNSSFAKLGIPTTPISQWFDHMSLPYKIYYPPAERMRRLKIRLRYHDGRVVNFGVFNYSFMLQFTLMVPQILRSSNATVYPPLQF
jgi:hypothetical protein